MRRIDRENAVKIIYSWMLSKNDINDTINFFTEIQEKGNKITEFTNELVLGTYKNINEIDDILKRNLEKWSIERLNKVDLAIFRIAIYELIYLKQEPTVLINEALEITRTLADIGDNLAVKFNNKVLDKIAKNESVK